MELTRELERDVRKVRQIQRRLETHLRRVLHHLPDYEQDQIMANFDAANAALATLKTTANSVEAAFQALQNADDQAGVDALTNGIGAVNTQLAALVPAPAPPAESA